MKSLYADLVADVVSSYNQTKTTIQGRVSSKTINSQTVLGPPLNKFVDVLTDSGQAPAAIFASSNDRIFVCGAVTAGVLPVMLYNFAIATGTFSYVGRINLTLPNSAATTHTIRSIKVLDTGTTDWKLFISTTGSVLINGGLFEAHKIALSDFVPVGFPTIPFATGNDQKAVYFHQDPANIGVGQLQTATAGMVLDSTNNLIYCHNGVAATHQYYVYSTSTVPTYLTNSVTGSQATDVITDTGHSYVANTPIVFTALTGGAGLTVGTTYFVRNPVAGVSYELSATSGGALLNFTTDITAGTVGRAFGTSGSNFSYKTGNLPALTGTLLLVDSEDYATPSSVNPAVDGFACAFFGTSSNLYLGRLSELTVGAVTWPSLQTSNLLGTVNQIVAPSATFVAWSNFLNRAFYVTNTSVVVMKQFLNNSIDSVFGGVGNKYLEAVSSPNVVEFQSAAVSALDLQTGWLFLSNSATAGQRGIYCLDARSEAQFDYSYIVTKVLSTPQSIYKFTDSLEQLHENTGDLEIYYRTSGFGSISGGWTLIPTQKELEGITTAGDQVQFKLRFKTLSPYASIPAQVNEFILGFKSLTEQSNYWNLSQANSTNTSPAKVAFRLQIAYPTSVPTMRVRGFDDTGSVIYDKLTTTHAAEFEYTTNNGTSWNPLGTIPNTALTTELRLNLASPSGVPVRWSIQEA